MAVIYYYLLIKIEFIFFFYFYNLGVLFDSVFFNDNGLGFLFV